MPKTANYTNNNNAFKLSVAPMMDWTDIAENLFSINKLDPLLGVALHLRCPEVTYGLS